MDDYKATFDEIAERAKSAQAKYGPMTSSHEALGVALEEWHELIDAIRHNDFDGIQQECIDLAAVLVRLADHIVSCPQEFINRSIKL